MMQYFHLGFAYGICYTGSKSHHGGAMRKALRTLVAFVSVFVLLVVLAGPAAAAPPAPKAKWTVMVYISGDNNLEDYVVKDLELELAPTGSSADVQVVALADRGPGYDTSRGDWQTTEFFHVTKGMTADLAHADADWDAQHADELDLGDPQTLIDFVTWTKTNYPADHYALVFWGHGWNWHPGYVMLDDTSADTLDYQEMKAALPSLGFIDVVGYDGCNMASIEIFDLWHGHATAVASSQEYVGWDGIEYDVVLAQLAANPAMSADAVDDRYTALKNAVNDWAVALNAGLAANRSKYAKAFTATRSFWQAPMDKDLYDMAYEIKRNVSTTDIKNKSQAVMNAITAVVLHERHVNAYADVHGITIYHISKASEKDDDYKYYRATVDFALETFWDEFLNNYAQ
jgi:hypothetical protein